MAVHIAEVRDWAKGLPVFVQAFLHQMELRRVLTSEDARRILALTSIGQLEPQVWVPLRAGFAQWAAGHDGVELQLFSTKRKGTFVPPAHEWTWVWNRGLIFETDFSATSVPTATTVVAPRRQMPVVSTGRGTAATAARKILNTESLRAVLQAAPNKTLSLVQITGHFPDADYDAVVAAAQGDKKIFMHRAGGGMNFWCYRG